ncbi:MAG TPA: HlyD family secretion protein [Candidatus Methylacidiphilales bacterium]|jgi:membrane fusion protein (multidrug efflux system)|nr:HlyD family secretion protein [Candidatus Methylacidiphilales bacterium]
MSTHTVADKVETHDHKTAKPVVVHKPASAPKKKLHPLVERYRKTALIIAGVAAAAVTAYYVFDAYTHEETDDAYVTGHLHEIAPRIAGTVTDVLVDDNQLVHQGDVLVKLDPLQYIALEMAAKANLDAAKADYDRLKPLVSTSAVSQQDVDNALSKFETDEAEYELTKLQIAYCTITAPATGYVGRKNVEVGNRLSTGQTLMDVVEPDLWIVANFKETQLAHMHRGQPVTIAIDSIPDKVFTGTVDSFSPATGNEFALLPADNSTGNFTKIVQRVPVKILFDADSIKGNEQRIRAGESAVVKVALTKPKSGPRE